MGSKYSARQRELITSECERLCARPSRVVEDLAFAAGCRHLPGAPISVPVGSALNMLILSEASNNGVESSAVSDWLPRLRNEAMLKLGEDTTNWKFEGPVEMERDFWPIIYGARNATRGELARLLGCCTTVTARQLRFYSQSDVEFISAAQYDLGGSGRKPRFTIDSHRLAERLQVTCGSPLFTARPTALH